MVAENDDDNQAPRSVGDFGADVSSLTVPLRLRDAAREAPDRLAVIDADVRLTFAQLLDAVNDVARSLLGLGLDRGERVAIWAPNSVRWVIAALAVHTAGGVLVPINTRFKGAEARYAVQRADAAMVIVEHGFLGHDFVAMLRGEGAAAAGGDAAAVGDALPIPSCPSVRRVISLSEHPDPIVLDWAQLPAWAQRVTPAALEEIVASTDPNSMVDILFTSGTTGDPKGAMTSHRANVLVDIAWSEMTSLRAGDVYLLVNPMFHSFGYRAGLIACIIQQATMVLQPVFDVAETLRLIEAERVTVFPGATTIYTSILDSPLRDKFDISSVRLVITGASVVPVALIRRIKQELGIGSVITAFGQTETAGTVTVCPPDAPDEKIAETSGVAIPGTEVRIMGEDGSLRGPGETGEIVVRGHNVMLGYFQDEAATAAAIDPQGWLHTGDIGNLDDEGYLRITDRIKDMYTCGGFNVYPAEVERCLAAHPAVSDSAVIGVPDHRMGEVGRAYVVLRPGADPTQEQIIAWCRENLANYKVPRSVAFVAEMPRNAFGKIQKFKLPA